jgi:hypothetical protein
VDSEGNPAVCPHLLWHRRDADCAKQLSGDLMEVRPVILDIGYLFYGATFVRRRSGRRWQKSISTV